METEWRGVSESGGLLEREQLEREQKEKAVAHRFFFSLRGSVRGLEESCRRIIYSWAFYSGISFHVGWFLFSIMLRLIPSRLATGDSFYCVPGIKSIAEVVGLALSGNTCCFGRFPSGKGDAVSATAGEKIKALLTVSMQILIMKQS